MTEFKQYKNMLELCNGAQYNKNVNGWDMLHEFDNSSINKSFDAKVYKQGNKIVLAFPGTKITDSNDLRNDFAIMFKQNSI